MEKSEDRLPCRLVLSSAPADPCTACEQGLDTASGDTLVRVDPRYFRPTEVDFLLGDPRKAADRLGWRHTTSFASLVAEMVEADLAAIHREQGRRDPGD